MGTELHLSSKGKMILSIRDYGAHENISYFSLNIRMIISRRVGWERHVKYMGRRNKKSCPRREDVLGSGGTMSLILKLSTRWR
jgi:hypothetical protein